MDESAVGTTSTRTDASPELFVNAVLPVGNITSQVALPSLHVAAGSVPTLNARSAPKVTLLSNIINAPSDTVAVIIL